MKTLIYILLFICPTIVLAQQPTEHYPVDSASVVHPGVPKGEVLKFKFTGSKIYPGTYREYSVYIPAQYDPAKPACVFVDQDAVQFKAPTVFDNLINSKEMPVTIGVFITPGRVVAADTTMLDRFNRSYEYDALGDTYASFLLEELLPDVEKHKTGDGRPIMLSKNGNDRAIGGTSSGAICAFTAAWERPDAFTRVFSGIGTYVSLRGGDRYPSLIRKYEPKPIRVFLQDGSHDQNAYGGDWFYANQMMARALEFSGYEVNHVWGEGAHNSNQSNAIFPEAMRWLWEGYPEPVKGKQTQNPFLSDILIPGEGWKLVTEGKGEISSLSPTPKGVLAGSKNLVYQLDENGKELSKALFKLSNVKCNSVLFTDTSANNYSYYYTGADGTPDARKIYLSNKKGGKYLLDQGLNNPYGMVFTPDRTQLYVTESNTHWVWIYNVNRDGSLTNKQRYGWLHVPDTAENARPREIKVDREGRVYVATNLGIQVMDQIGRVNCILPLPFDSGQPTRLCFGGPNADILFVSCGDKIYRHKLKVKGMNDFDTPIKPPKPHL